MTQKTYSVSPLIPACPKSGVIALAFRPADPGDTAAPFFNGRSVPVTHRSASRGFPALSLCNLAPRDWLVCFFGLITHHFSLRAKRVFTRMVPRFSAPYRETNFFFKPQN
jgi:hypothetical protein